MNASILSQESITLGGIPIYFSALIILLLFGIMWLVLFRKKLKFSDKRFFSMAFIALSIYTLIIALVYTITGIFLFSDGSSLRIYMFIATVGIFIYVKNSIADLYKKE